MPYEYDGFNRMLDQHIRSNSESPYFGEIMGLAFVFIFKFWVAIFLAVWWLFKKTIKITFGK